MMTMRLPRFGRANGRESLLVAMVGGALFAFQPIQAQTGRTVVAGQAQACPQARVDATIGVSGLDCVGECSVTLSDEGKEEAWSFSAEPRIFQIDAGSPADGVLQPGDFLVAIDGVLITTREGGRRFANLEPGTQVRVSYRRDGVVRETTLDVGSRCADPLPTLQSGRMAPPPPPRPRATEPPADVATVPRIRTVIPIPPDTTNLPRMGGSIGLLYGDRMNPRPRGRLGIGFACSDCGTIDDKETGQEVWYFSGPVEVTQVSPGGAAERAGIQIGDFITALDGKDLATEAGTRAFSDLAPGKAVEITLTRRNGRVETVRLVPEEPADLPLPAPSAVASPSEPPEPRSLGAAIARPPAAPAAAEAAVGVDVPSAPLAEVMAGPEDLPVSYSGIVEGVEVVVRGGPVSVSELRGARTFIIRSDGLWIRVRVPAVAPRPRGGTGGGT